MAFLEKNLLKGRKPVITTDWPLSLGIPVYVIGWMVGKIPRHFKF